MKRKITFIIILIVLFVQTTNIISQQRFPKPEFESGHVQPPTITPPSKGVFYDYLDVFMLIAGLSVMSWMVLKKRSRKGVFWISVFSLAYFGFFREGCVCSVGSLQNIILALFNPEYNIPASVIAFFIIPLIYTLFFGRTFCAGICPFGALQDLIALRPVNLKTWIQKALGMIPFIYLGLAILYAATSTDFVICRYDPFVGIFRFNATFFMYVIGGMLLICSVFISRPYCRFICPYGVLLNLLSRISRKHLTITPTQCINCRLCEECCPNGAIQKPVGEKVKEDRDLTVKRFFLLVFIIPLLVIVGGWTGARFHENFAKVNPKVHLANELLSFDGIETDDLSEEIKAFTSSGKEVEELFDEAAIIVKKFHTGAWILGGFIGLVFGLTLAGLSIFRFRTDYTPNKGKCLSCVRCVEYCPVDKDIKINTN
ncbi:4Fe-4S binding protein [Bacteroidota bacterium]